MKKRISFRKMFVVAFFACMLMYSFNAYAGLGDILGSITGKLFTTILEMIGFGSETDGYCWFCPLFRAVFVSSDAVAAHVALDLRDTLVATLGVGILFFVGFRVGATLIKLQEVDLMQFLGDLFKHLGRAIIAVALIMAGKPIFEHLITPLLSMSFELAINLMNNTSFGDGNNVTHFAEKYMGIGEMTGDAGSICSNIYSTTVNTQILAPELLNSMMCMLSTVSANLVLGMVVGLCVIGVGMFGSVIFPNTQQCLSGLIIFGAFFAIYLTVPFRLMDNLIRLAFVAALMPFWIILWVFPATVQYTKNAWNMFVATCVSFVSFGVVLALIMTLMNYMVPDLSGILQALIPGYEFFASSKASVFTTNTLLTFGLGVFCKQLLGVPDEFAARIANSYGIGIGSQVEAQVVKSGASGLGILGKTAVIGGAVAAYAGEGLGGKIQSSAKSAKDTLWNGGTIWDGMFDGTSSNKGNDSSKPARTPQTNPAGNSSGNEGKTS